MSLLIILLILLFILVILKLYFIKEGFEDGGLSQNTINDYNKFKEFYNQFITNWEKAITSSIVLDTPQEPLTSPSQTSSLNPPNPSTNDMNLYINKLSSDLNKKLPYVTELFPEQINSTILPEIISKIPEDSEIYINALDWMNEQLEKAHSNLNIDNFEDMCHDISTCIANNPELLAKIAEAQQVRGQKQIQENEQILSNRINKFFSNSQIEQSIQKNTELVKKTESIQKQAESGQLLNNFSSQISNQNTQDIKYDIPKGGNALTELKQNDPKKYNELQSVAPQLFSIKQLIEQINKTL